MQDRESDWRACDTEGPFPGVLICRFRSSLLDRQSSPYRKIRPQLLGRRRGSRLSISVTPVPGTVYGTPASHRVPLRRRHPTNPADLFAARLPRSGNYAREPYWTTTRPSTHSQSFCVPPFPLHRAMTVWSNFSDLIKRTPAAPDHCRTHRSFSSGSVSS